MYIYIYIERLKFTEVTQWLFHRKNYVRGMYASTDWMELCEQQREGISTAFSRPCGGGGGGERFRNVHAATLLNPPGTFLPGTRNDVGGCIK